MKPDIIPPQVVNTTFGPSKSILEGFGTWNLIIAALYVVQAVVVWVLAHGQTLPVGLNYLTTDPLQSAVQGGTVRTLASHQWFTLNVLYLVLLALFVAAIAHLLAATYYRKGYDAALGRRAVPLRWAVLAISGSLLLLSLGLLMGIQDIAVLLALVGFGVIVAAGAWVIERVDIGAPLRQKLLLSLFGFVGLLPLALLACYLFGSAVYGVATPVYLYGLWAVAAAGYVLGALQLLVAHRRQGAWADYRFADRGYSTLGLVVTSALTWLIFAGALH